MADGILLGGREFGEGTPVTEWAEQRIVTEATRPNGVAQQRTLTLATEDRLLTSCRNQSHGTDKARGPARIGHVGEALEQKCVVRLVELLTGQVASAREPLRTHAGRTAERIDAQTESSASVATPARAAK